MKLEEKEKMTDEMNNAAKDETETEKNTRY
jgi:hypothetical protein